MTNWGLTFLILRLLLARLTSILEMETQRFGWVKNP